MNVYAPGFDVTVFAVLLLLWTYRLFATGLARVGSAARPRRR